jgi:NAD(P)-dependent dehydrogenase (short-subunit alcohol dehydrogenase family)
MAADRPVVLITGCSSGIGRGAARRFAAAGYRVYASMRRPDERPGVELRAEAAAAGWTLATPPLDVTSDASVGAAVAALLAETAGRIDVLVNNAGYYLVGAVEETAPDELRDQLETNVVGVLRVTRAVLPAMRARGAGAVVNVSSVAGRVALPVVGGYHASKWALECLTEALRYEVRPFGIRVAAVEPGPFKTGLHDNERRVRDGARPDSPYRPLVATYDEKSRRMRRGPVDAVVDVIFRAATARRPRLRWAVGPTSFSGTVLRRLCPDGIYELALRLAFRWGKRDAAGALPPGPETAPANPGRAGSDDRV